MVHSPITSSLATIAFSMAVFAGWWGSVQTDRTIRMPDVRPEQNDAYLCTSFEMKSEAEYIVGFDPQPSERVHHILIFGCSVPSYKEVNKTWICNPMAEPNNENRYGCAEGEQVIYVWAMNAPELKLPEKVGFKVGGNSGINYLVLNVHYADASTFGDDDTDDSGVTLTTVDEATGGITRRAAVIVLGTDQGTLPAKKETVMERACVIDEDVTFTPFAFRTHTHGLGQIVSGWKVSSNEWTLIGKRNPQLPQMFVPVENQMTVTKGDALASRCILFNNRDHDTKIGAAHHDEMCMFYLMYYVEGEKILDKKICRGPGYPTYNWTSDPIIKNVPSWVDESSRKLD